MDHQLSSFLFYFVLFCMPLCLFFFLYRRKSSTGTNLPPGRTGWPIIGETIEFGMTARRGCPEQFVNDRMQKYCPEVFRTSLLGDNLAVFCGAAGNKFLFSSENKYVTSWWPRSVDKIFFSPEDTYNYRDETSKSKSFLPEFLRPEGLQHFIPIMDSMAREHIAADWSEQKEVKVFPLTKKYTFALAFRLFVNIKDPEYLAKLADAFNEVTTGLLSVPIDFPGTPFGRAVKAAKIVREELLATVEERKRQLSEGKGPAVADILTRMLLASDENGETMNGKEIVRKIFGLLIASYDTTSASITAVVKFLAEYPHVYEKVFQEQLEISRSKAPGELLNWDDIQKMKYSWCVVCEAMRLVPPSPGAYGEAIADFTYAGFSIPKGWKTYWDAHSTHKSPKYYSEPEKFDPSRFEGNGPAPFTFVPFGGGPRKCPGREYARMEILVLMHNIVTKFKWEKVVPDEGFIYTPFPVPAHGLPVRLQTH